MDARRKLNSGYFLGSVLVASLVGIATGSWLAGIIAFVVLFGINVNNGDIRM